MLVALTRDVPSSIARCELTHLPRAPINYARAEAQHRVYRDALASAGCRLVDLPPTPELPDAVFVEDTAVVLDEVGVITRPGAPSRRAETATVAEALGRYRALVAIQAPATLDGGDVLPIGRRVYVGLSTRSNAQGIKQLADAVRPHGYEVIGVPVRGCLHLKSAVTRVSPDTLLVNPGWVDAAQLGGLRAIDVDPGEPFAANALLIGERVIYPANYERTRERLERGGVEVDPVDVSELAKAEGGVTCCSLVFEA